MHLLDLIQQWVLGHPERDAHRSGDRRMSYGELGERSDLFGAWLDRELEGKPGPVAVHGHKEPEMLVAFLAAVKCGRAYVPIDISVPAQRVERIIEGAGAALVVTPDLVARVLGEQTDEARGALRERTLRRVEADDAFYILFTSGSTGEPKGVVITLSNLTAFVEWMMGEQRYTAAGEVFLNQAPFSFDLSVMDLYGSLTSGGTLQSVTKEELSSLKALYKRLGESAISTWVSTPSFAQMCLIEKGFSQEMMPEMRRFLFCGETLAPETASQLLERFPKAEVWNTYGPTEATVATTSVRVDRALIAEYSPLPVGLEMPGTRILICGEDGVPVAEGDRGEIVIVGPNVSPGYLNRPELTGKVFGQRAEGRFYRTGDWGRMRGGQVFFEGRMDGQIKLNGYRIELGDMEANLRGLEEVADAVVLPVQKGGKVDSLAAFIVLAGAKEGSDFEVTARLKARLGERLPVYMVPRKFLYKDAFPMTPNGKADRRKLAEELGG